MLPLCSERAYISRPSSVFAESENLPFAASLGPSVGFCRDGGGGHTADGGDSAHLHSRHLENAHFYSSRGWPRVETVTAARFYRWQFLVNKVNGTKAIKILLRPIIMCKIYIK